MPANVIVPHDPSFSPEGNRVAFDARESTGGETSRIYLAPASGGEATALTQGAVSARQPAWKPGPQEGPSGGGSGGESPGGGGSSGGEVPGSGSGGSGGATPRGGSSGGSTSTGGANPPATRAPVVLQLAAFRHPDVSGAELSGGYVPCNLGSTNAVCQAQGEATYVAPITHSLTYSRSNPKPLVFAKGSVTVPAGKTKPLPLKITAAGKKLLMPGKKIKLTVTIVETAPGAKPKTTTKTFTVTAPKKH